MMHKVCKLPKPAHPNTCKGLVSTLAKKPSLIQKQTPVLKSSKSFIGSARLFSFKSAPSSFSNSKIASTTAPSTTAPSIAKMNTNMLRMPSKQFSSPKASQHMITSPHDHFSPFRTFISASPSARPPSFSVAKTPMKGHVVNTMSKKPYNQISIRSSVTLTHPSGNLLVHPQRYFQTSRMAQDASYKDKPANEYQKKVRNIGISAHIDSGKTTLTERVLFYTGRIKEIREVRGGDGGAKMDSMELEREKGITIKSAATHCHWGENRINIIDTPGHVDFTIEVERSLRVLDGAVLVLCGVGGVQSQTITVDRQMKRYNVPRIVFINKMDRPGANEYKVVDAVRGKLRINAALVALPFGRENLLKGVIDVITQELVMFEGANGETLKRGPVPEEYKEKLAKAREALLDSLSGADDEIFEILTEGEEPTPQQLKDAIRRATIKRQFAPVFVGSALKNTGVQHMLDGVIDYLPSPMDLTNTAFDVNDPENQKEFEMNSDIEQPFAGLAFKLEDGRYGQLTYMRVYRGRLSRGDTLQNIRTGKKTKVPRLVRMHSDEMEEAESVGCGEICAIFGMECNSGDSFVTDQSKIAMSSIHVPDPVLSLSIRNKDKKQSGALAKALNRFQREDPTFTVSNDPESGELLIHGMGELHLEIYIERMKREYNIELEVGNPKVAYRETIQSRADFDFTHKKQSGGAGQYAKMIGYIEPIPYNDPEEEAVQFRDDTIGATIPPQYIPGCQKGFIDALSTGSLTGHRVIGVRMVATDGNHHPVDSSELAFRTCAQGAFKESFQRANPTVLEPVMRVEIQAPVEYQGLIIGQVNKRAGLMENTEQAEDFISVTALIPLSQMFGYATELRGGTQGKGEFTMEYAQHSPVSGEILKTLTDAYKREREQHEKGKKVE